MTKSWASLENYVRALSQIIWSKPFTPQRIDGVNFDAYAEISDEEIVVIEVTEEFNLEKVRGDVTKIAAFKMRNAANSILVRAYIILNKQPTPGMLEIGKSHKIKVISINEFSAKAFDFSSYVLERNKKTFGSSIDPITGETDNNIYIPVSYLTHAEEKRSSIDDICTSLSKKNKIVLLGDYGTGKSRCAREVFQILTNKFLENSAFPLAINLQDHWGAQTGIEIISGHFQRLGLSHSIDRVMQLLNAGFITLLLDGFDEVGTQTFGNSEDKRASIRNKALKGVRDLINISKGGTLVTGRPHYFNDNSELLTALGLNLRNNDTQLILCADEFNQEQACAYLTALNIKIAPPKWLPKKPLIFQIIGSMDTTDAEKVLSTETGEVSFWGQFIDAVCERESKAHPSIEASTVRSVLANLARFTRISDRELGRLTPKLVQQSYEISTGHSPDEAGQLMLSRLCTLGRIEPESPDRQFVDPYIVQLLFADAVIEDITNKSESAAETGYIQPLQKIGILFLTQWIDIYNFESEAINFIHRFESYKNKQIIAEITSALLLIEGDEIDFSGLTVSEADIQMLSLNSRSAKNIEISDCIINNLHLDNCKVNDDCNFKIKKTDLINIHGLSSIQAIPKWIEDCKSYNIQSISTASRIKSSPLSPSQKLFLSIIQKIFFQRGSGRKDNSLYKSGFGQSFDRKIIDQILHKLVAEGIVEKSKDASSYIYNPRREYTSRMKAIKDQLTLSKDPLWIEIGEIKH